MSNYWSFSDTATAKTHRSQIRPCNAAQSAVDKLPPVPMGSDSEMQEYAAGGRRGEEIVPTRPDPSPVRPAAAAR